MKLVLDYPIKNFYISQEFGETKLLDYYKQNGLNIPGHNGIDFVANYGTPIFASHDGTAYYEVDSKQGHGVVVRTDEEYFYDTEKSMFISSDEAYANGYKE